MINLYEQLPELEKTRLNNYIYKWGTKNNFIGLENWLSNWNHSKQKLYKMLGNKFIYTKDISYTKSDDELKSLIRRNLLDEYVFPCHWRSFINFLYNYKKDNDKYANLNNETGIDYGVSNMLCNFVSADSLMAGCVIPKDRIIKIKKANATREFRTQGGCKIFRAITQVIKYYDEEIKIFVDEYNKGLEEKDRYYIKDFFKEFEEFRNQYSIVVNDKKFEGQLHISINPIDFLTMSDNSSWCSCMNWRDAGCYHIGTVEMLNSNNVVCCYITKGKNKDFDFFLRHDKYYYDSDKALDYEGRNIKEWSCSDKKFRQLFYVTKDIIVGGKSYPFENDCLTKIILDTVKNLAKKNLNWNYQYGPERYLDMKYINNDYSMERAKWYRKYSPKKKNILFDTKGMYNDMVADNYTHYWCYRNKVDKTKIISYSGKAPCLCCGKSVIYLNEDMSDYDYEDCHRYHDKYLNCGNVVCEDCLDLFCSCDYCHSKDSLNEFYYIEQDGVTKRFCKHCWEEKARVCPDCEEVFIDKNSYKADRSYIRNKEYEDEPLSFSILPNANYGSYFKLAPFICCPKCMENHKDLFEIKDLSDGYCARPVSISKEAYDLDDLRIKKYLGMNLKRPDPEKFKQKI